MIGNSRFSKAVELWQSGAVSHNGQPGQYYVLSQTGNGQRYLAASSWAACGLKCNCEDARRGHTCKHILAAGLEHARSLILARVAKGEHLAAIRDEIISYGCGGGNIKDEREDVAWECLYKTVQLMEAGQVPGPVDPSEVQFVVDLLAHIQGRAVEVVIC